MELILQPTEKIDNAAQKASEKQLGDLNKNVFFQNVTNEGGRPKVSVSKSRN
jgi:hypothetical protein